MPDHARHRRLVVAKRQLDIDLGRLVDTVRGDPDPHRAVDEIMHNIDAALEPIRNDFDQQLNDLEQRIVEHIHDIVRAALDLISTLPTEQAAPNP